MTDKTEALPEALRLAEWIEGDMSCQGDAEIAAELRRLHAKIEQLKAQLSARQPAPNPWQQAIDHELVCLHLGVAGVATKESALKALQELIQCHVEIAINPQTNGGLSLQPHTEAQTVPDGWRLVPVGATLNMLDTAFGICTKNGQPVQQLIESAAAKYAALLSAAPPPPEREPHPPTRHCMCVECAPSFKEDSSHPLTDEQIEEAYKDLQARRKKSQDEAFQAGIGKSCTNCSDGRYQADWNGYSTFHRCDKCRHVPFDLSGLVKKSAASCWCETCDTAANNGLRTRMSLCPTCGNKRCPRSSHHDNACTNSNAPGQKGSSWEHVKPHGANND